LKVSQDETPVIVESRMVIKASDCCYEISRCCSWCWCESKSTKQCFLNSLWMMFMYQHTLVQQSSENY